MSKSKEKLNGEYDFVERVLVEAEQLGLRNEVGQTARMYIEMGFDVLTAYRMAYGEWIK